MWIKYDIFKWKSHSPPIPRKIQFSLFLKPTGFYLYSQVKLAPFFYFFVVFVMFMYESYTDLKWNSKFSNELSL